MVSVIRVQPLARSCNAQFMRTHGAYVEASISVLSEYSQWPTPDGWVGSVANHIADMRPPHTHRTALCCLQPSMQWARKASRSTRKRMLAADGFQATQTTAIQTHTTGRGCVRGQFTISRTCYRHTRIVRLCSPECSHLFVGATKSASSTST